MVESLKILFLCIAAAIVYGVMHDQITARVCIEYFTVFHPPVFQTQSPTLLGIGWGIIATWWVGASLGVLLALFARAGSRPKLSAVALFRPIGKLLLVMAACAATSGLTGYFLARNGLIVPPMWVASGIPPSAHARFMADWWAHSASYAVGFFGGIVLCFVQYRKRAVARTRPQSGNSVV
jgi:hypothetical protein